MERVGALDGGLRAAAITTAPILTILCDSPFAVVFPDALIARRPLARSLAINGIIALSKTSRTPISRQERVIARVYSA